MEVCSVANVGVSRDKFLKRVQILQQGLEKRTEREKLGEKRDNRKIG